MLFLFLVAFLLLEESLHTKKGSEKEDGGSSQKRETTLNLNRLETETSSNSLQSGDSGIELSSGVKTIGSDASLHPPDNTSNDELTMMESDIDTDSDIEVIDSDTELLLETQSNSKNSDGSGAHSYLSRSFKSSVSSCLVRECGPRQCYGRVRNSLVDSYDCVVLCVECLKSCVTYRHGNRWRPGEVKGQAKTKLRNAIHSVLNLLRLILDRRVFLSTLLYALLAFFTIMCNEVSSWIYSYIAIRYNNNNYYAYYTHFKGPLNF